VDLDVLCRLLRCIIVRPTISSTNLSILGNRMKHCGKAFSKKESKSFVSSKEIKKISH
jgi:hypothetical protein